MESFILYRGERRKLTVNMAKSLNGATGSDPAVTIHRARGMADVSAALLVSDPTAPAFVGSDVEFWVDAQTWTEVARLRVRISCTANSGERPVERDVTLLIQ